MEYMNKEEKIILFDKLKESRYKEETNEMIFQKLIKDSKIISNKEKYPIICERINKQNNKEKIEFDDREKEFIYYLINEVSIFMAIIPRIERYNMIDYEGCLEIFKTDLLLLEIKIYLVEEFSNVIFSRLKDKNFEPQKYNISSDFLNIVYDNISNYLKI